ncbi:hypothetical protein [Duncaniella muris]|uniref:hypothetical protein n=1 Tax=Duncaniella muris TaxID=2094150 RepID=UPI00272B6F6B|nr:hypothetical protein [Duncaniella muris]
MKRIQRPQLTNAVRLSAREMNSLHFSPKHTVLTPALLEKMAGGRTDADKGA